MNFFFKYQKNMYIMTHNYSSSVSILKIIILLMQAMIKICWISKRYNKFNDNKKRSLFEFFKKSEKKRRENVFLLLRVFGQLSSYLLISITFGRYVLRPSSGVCRPRECLQHFELRHLLNPRESPVLILLAITGY